MFLSFKGRPGCPGSSLAGTAGNLGLFSPQLDVIKSVSDTLLFQKPLTSDLKAETNGGIEFLCIKSERLSRNASFKAGNCRPPHVVITLGRVYCVGGGGLTSQPLEGGGVTPQKFSVAVARM